MADSNMLLAFKLAWLYTIEFQTCTQQPACCCIIYYIMIMYYYCTIIIIVRYIIYASQTNIGYLLVIRLKNRIFASK
jgi:hypothetical protein